MHARRLFPIGRPGSALPGIVLLLLAGCATVPRPVPKGAVGEGPAPAEAVQSPELFLPLDPPTRQAVSCPALAQRLLADGRLEVLASLRNETAAPVKAAAGCVFKDAGGAPGAATAWQNVLLLPHGTETLRFESADPKAARFTVAVRLAK